MKRSTLSQLLCALLLSLFLYAALSKLLNYPQFVSQLTLHPLLRPVSGVMAWALPAVEILVSICLFFPLWRLNGLYASFLLLVIFSVYILGMLLTASHLPCSCGGVFQHLTWGEHLICNTILAVLALWAIRLERLNKEQELMIKTNDFEQDIFVR